MLWAAVFVVPLGGGALLIAESTRHEPGIVVVTALAVLGFLPVWASAVHQLGLAMRALLRARRDAGIRGTPPVTGPDARRVAVVMCTADDFDARRARACADQDIPVELIVLDDSRTPEMRAAVDGFARSFPCRVVRRPDRQGFKGGNLSHALEVLADGPELWLLVDSDQSLPRHAARELRSRMAKGVAVVQGMPVARAAQTRFTALLGALPETHLGVSQRGRTSPWFLGRVALLDTRALRAVGGVPGCVMEDIALTVELRRAGFRIVDAPEVRGEEDAPVDLRAFRVQQLKFLSGAVELVRRRGRAIVSAPIPLAERLDLLLGHLLVPAAILGGALALACGTVLAASGAFPLAMGIASAGATLAPLAAELARLLRAGRPLAAVRTALLLPALYGSLLFAALGTLVRLAVGEAARFTVTPKRAAAHGWVALLRAHRGEIALAGLGVALVAVSPAFVMPLAAPAAACLGFGLLGRYSTVASNSPSATRMLRRAPELASVAARTTRSPMRTTA